jgi:hypothetical protein
MAIAVVLLALILDILVQLTAGGKQTFFIVARDVLWIVDFVLLVLASGGLSLHELGGEFKNAYEVMRRGETTPTLVIPKKDNPYAERHTEAVAPTTTPAPAVNPVGPTSPNSPGNPTNTSSIPLS